MDTIVSAVLSSWRLDPRVVAILLGVALLYVRGWLRGRRLIRHKKDLTRLTAFFGGLAAVFFALESPLDAFDTLFLSAHMTQHMLLMMIAPPLLLLGHPLVPMLRGLPRKFVKEGLVPFLSWPSLRKVLRWLTSPPIAWLILAVSTIVWHLPKLYQLALRSPEWHSIQHACFFWTGILFWWPVIEPRHGNSRWPRWTMIPYLLLADVINTALSAFLIFSGRVLYPVYEAARMGSISALHDQATAGAIMWVPGSLVYLLPAIVIAVGQFSGTTMVKPGELTVRLTRKRRDHFGTIRLRLPKLRRAAQSVMLLLAIAVMADGFRGTQVAPMNLAGVLPWIHWRALSLLALLLVGNLFCMVCPFTLARDFGRRIFPARLRWPRLLRTKWLPASLFVFYLWAYEALGLWDSPWLTASIVAGYFATILVVDGVFRGASFCKYVCPIGQFHFVSSLTSPGEIGIRSADVCHSCRTHDCIRGNDRVHGCELDLFQPKKAGNLDCTFCLDCVKACPHDNVAWKTVVPATTLALDPDRSSIGMLSKRTDIAVFAVLVVFGAFVNAAGMVAPVMAWEHGWHARLGAEAMPLVIAALIAGGVVVLPGVAVLLCGALNKMVDASIPIADVTRRFVLAFVPIGVAMWAAHLFYHFATAWNASLTWLTPVQLLLLDAGLLLTLYVLWQLARQYSKYVGQAISLILPWALVSCGLYCLGVWIFFQPMQMRGVMK